MWNPLKRRSREDNFWLWFSRNREGIFHFERDQRRVFDELSSKLNGIHESLCFEFGPDLGGRREFIISADGDKKAFPAVQALAASAPEMREWKVTPFRPPIDISKYSKVESQGVSLSVEDVWFRPELDGAVIHLDLYIRGLTKENESKIGFLSFLLLDQTLGEFVVETRIGGISRSPLPEDPEKLALRPFPELLEVVDLPVQ